MQLVKCYNQSTKIYGDLLNSQTSQTLSRPGSHQVLWHLILDAGRNGGNGGNGWMGSKVDDAKWSNLLKNCFGSTQSCSFSYFILNLNLLIPEESFMLKDKLQANFRDC